MVSARYVRSALFFSLVIILGAQAGVLLVSSNESLQSKGEPRTHKIYLDRGKVRMEIEGEAQYFIYRSDRALFWIVDNTKNTYAEMTKQDVEALSSQMGEAIKMMHDQLKNLTAAQQKKIEDLMSAQTQGTITYKQTAGGETVNEWTCDKYEGTLNGVKENEIWTTDPKNLSIPAEDFKVMKDMASFFEKFARNMKGLLPSADETHGFPGVPVRTIIFEGGKPDWQSDVTETKTEDFPASLFEVPAGMKKKSLATME